MDKPKKVSVGIKLLIISLAIGILATIIDVVADNSTLRLSVSQMEKFPISFEAIIAIFISIYVISYGLMSLFVYKIHQGRKWARTVLLVLFCIGLLFFPFSIMNQFEANAMQGALLTLQIVIEIVAMVFLLSKEGNAWFNRSKEFISDPTVLDQNEY